MKKRSRAFARRWRCVPIRRSRCYNLARALLALDRLEEAAESFRAARAAAGPDIEPSRLIDLHNSLCETLMQQAVMRRRLPSAAARRPRSRTRRPIHWNESLTLLMLGDYAEGWRKYECRFLVPDHDPPREGAAVLDSIRLPGGACWCFPSKAAAT